MENFSRKPTRRSPSSITAFFMATGFLKEFAFTTGASSGWKNISSGCGIPPARSASRFRSSRGEMTEALLETIRQNGLNEGYVRLIVTRGVGNLGLNPAQCKRPSVIIIATTIALYSKEVCETGLTVVTCATRRTGAAALNPAVKSLNYLNNVMARIEANLAGADEALMLNDAGNVAECTADNVFIIKHGQIFTPPISCRGAAGDHTFGRFRDRGGTWAQDHARPTSRVTMSLWRMNVFSPARRPN